MGKKMNPVYRRWLLPLMIVFIVFSGLWNFINYADSLYLLLSIVILPVCIYVYFTDIKQFLKAEGFREKQERIRTEARIKHMTNYDDLTGLPNRRMFRKELNNAVERAKQSNALLCVMFVDIDRFKLVNDSLGHDYGDILLLQIAERLNRNMKKTDFIARMEGDEFALFFTGLKHADEAIEIADNILKELEPTFNLQDFQLHITISIGISMLSNDEDTTESLMKYADSALSRTKELGRNNYQMFTPSMNTQSVQKFHLENELRQAIDNQEFKLLYQPQIHLKTGEIIGVEALIRWNHPEQGVISPEKFIPQVEENGMIVPIGDWVLLTACKQNKLWQDAGFGFFPISVNLSIRQFLQQNLLEKIQEILAVTGLDPRYLELEITESMTLDVEHAIGTLQKLKDLGVGIIIDDFGTGYSSLNHLKKLPIHKLKIDRSFVRDLMVDANDEAIVSTIITMAHGLDMKVVAEGVETREQLEYLSMKQCNEVQGYLFSEPLAVEDFSDGMLRVREVAASLDIKKEADSTASN